MDTNGDGTGTFNAVGDYSLTAERFYIQPALNQIYELSRMMIMIQDTGSFDADLYGNNIGLTNGINLEVKQGGPEGGVLIPMTPVPIMNNSQWGANCFDVDVKAWGDGDEVLVARWSFSKDVITTNISSNIGGITLNGALRQCLVITLNDDFSSLNDHTFAIRGVITAG